MGSIAYGGWVPACVDQLIGIRTELKPAFLMSPKYRDFNVIPQAPSCGASRALPRLMPRPSRRLWCWVSSSALKTGVLIAGRKATITIAVVAPVDHGWDAQR